MTRHNLQQNRSIAVYNQSPAAVRAHQDAQGLHFGVSYVGDACIFCSGTNQVRTPFHRDPVPTHGFLDAVFIQDATFRADRRVVEI